MHAQTDKLERVADLMHRRNMDLGDLVSLTGLDPRVAEAIAFQRYTPSPEQRDRVCGVLGVGRDGVLWGHATAVDASIHEPI